MRLIPIQIEALFDKHPDKDLFDGSAGAKKVLGPRLLAAIAQTPTVIGSHDELRHLAGTAPVSFHSGRIGKVQLCWGCDKFLRHTVLLWANGFRRTSAWGQAYYARNQARKCRTRVP